MKQFSTTKWFRNQYQKETNLNEKLEDQKVLKEEKSKNDRIFDLFFNELEDFDGVADYLNRYRSTIMRGLDSIDFDYLPKPSMMEEAEDMVTYSVTGITQDPDGGGDAPFGPVDVQIKADTSEDDLYLTIKRAAEDEIADRIYKIKDYSKK